MSSPEPASRAARRDQFKAKVGIVAGQRRRQQAITVVKERRDAAVRAKRMRRADDSNEGMADDEQISEKDKKYGSDDGVESESDGPISDVENFSLTPYQALLGSLSTNGGNFSEAIAQRQTEEQGLSSSEDSESMRAGENLADHEDGVGTVSASQQMRNSRAEIMDKPSDEETLKAAKVAELQEDSDDDATLLADSGSTNPFKKHLDHLLTDKEVSLLSKGGAKFKCETTAAGVQKAKWTTTASEFPVEEGDLQSYGVKLRLQKSWLACHKKLACGDFQTTLQRQFFSYCNSYRDILFSKRPCFYADGDLQDMEIMDAYLLHMLNHVLKTRDLVTKNNEKKGNSVKVEEAPRDQGFTRPKVLILLPLRSSALRLVKRLLDLVPSRLKGNIEHKARFFEEFGVEDKDADESAGKAKSLKPADFNALFGGDSFLHLYTYPIFRGTLQSNMEALPETRTHWEKVSGGIFFHSPVVFLGWFAVALGLFAGGRLLLLLASTDLVMQAVLHGRGWWRRPSCRLQELSLAIVFGVSS